MHGGSHKYTVGGKRRQKEGTMDNNVQQQYQAPQAPKQSKFKAFFVELKDMFKAHPWQMVFVIVVTLILASPFTCGGCIGCLGCAACASGAADTDPTPPVGSGEGQGEVDTGKLGNYIVNITSYRLGHDYEGNPVIYVSYEYTNNGSEAAAFAWTFDYHAYQNGIELESCYVPDDADNYDSALASSEIKPGVTLVLECAYVLRDTTTPVEVEVSELISLSDDKVEKTFEIAA